MTLSFDDIQYMNQNFEGQIFDRKSIGILSHPNDLAELMVAFGNNKFVSEDFGGIILIGINDNGEYEEFETKQGHEELIMNVAQQNIYPPMTPEFEVVSSGEKNVYAVTIPKMTTTPYSLKTKDGFVYKKRVGSTIRNALFEEVESLKKDSDGTESKEQRIEANFPSSSDQPFIKITVIPMDANRQLINFDKENTEWLKSNLPKHTSVRTRTLKQNEIHYESSAIPSPDSVWFVLNQNGEFSGIEFIKLHQESIVHIGRQIVFIQSALHYIQEVYTQFKYSGRISVKLEFNRVQGRDFMNTDLSDPFHWTEKQFTINPIPIKRIVSLDTLNIDSLVTSIFVEICRACDWTIDESAVHKYLEGLAKRVPF